MLCASALYCLAYDLVDWSIVNIATVLDDWLEFLVPGSIPSSYETVKPEAIRQERESMQAGSFETLIGWKSGQITYVPLWDRMEGAWLWAQGNKNWIFPK
jgi:hypothetical protein